MNRSSHVFSKIFLAYKNAGTRLPAADTSSAEPELRPTLFPCDFFFEGTNATNIDLVRASIIADYKQAKSYMEEREEKREKKVGASLVAG